MLCIPVEVPNGSVQYSLNGNLIRPRSSYEVGTKAYYGCNDGFAMETFENFENYLTCTANGLWDTRLPEICKGITLLLQIL